MCELKEKPTCRWVKAFAFTHLQVGEGIRLHPNRITRCNCNHCCSCGDASAGIKQSQRNIQADQMQQ